MTKVLTASGWTKDPLTKGSAPGPRWGLCPQTPVIGSCSALAMVPPTTDPFRCLCVSVCSSRPQNLQNRTNRSRCRLGVYLWVHREPCGRLDPGSFEGQCRDARTRAAIDKLKMTHKMRGQHASSCGCSLPLLWPFVRVGVVTPVWRWLHAAMYTSPGPPLTQCGAREFSCEEDASCIPSQLVCDGKYDCSDASDEFNCGQSLSNIQKQLLSLPA